MDDTTQQRDSALALMILVVASGLAFAFYTPIWPPDLAALYFAARLAHEGQLAEIYTAKEQIFSGNMPPSWADLATRLGHPDQTAYPYIYPPFWARVFAPLVGALAPFAFFKAVFAVQLVLLIGAILATRQIMSAQTIPASLWALICAATLAVSTIGFGALVQNQPQITVTCLVVFSLLRLKQGGAVSAGLLLALAAAIKLTPILLLLLFAVEREWRAAATTLAALVAFAVASALMIPAELHAQFFAQLDNVQAILPMMPLNFSLQTFLGWLIAGEQMQIFARSVTVVIWVKPAWLDPLGLALMIAGLAATFWVTRTLGDDDRYRIRPFAALLLIYSTGPLGWSHYYLPLLFCLPGLMVIFPLRLGAGLAVLFALGWSYALHQRFMALDPQGGLVLSWNVALLCTFLAMLWMAALQMGRRS
ncbi:MAG: glycosyltransferase family 87 protein [Pseudomonadota bacterium]